MIHNILINSKNNVGGDNTSNYKYNFDFSPLQDGKYTMGFNFTTDRLKTVTATSPISISSVSTVSFTTNSLTVTDVSSGYKYALSNGTPYLCSSSSVRSPSYDTFRGINDSAGGTGWAPTGNSYDASGNYLLSVQTTIDGNIINGEWIQIRLPYLLNLTSFSARNMYQDSWARVKDFTLAGSNNGTTWNLLLNNSFTNFGNTGLNSFSIPSNQNFYSYYRLIIKNVVIGNIVAPPAPDLPYTPIVSTWKLIGNTNPINNPSVMVIEMEELGTTRKAYKTINLTEANTTNIIGIISPLTTGYKFNNFLSIMSKPQSSQFRINLKDLNGNLKDIDENYCCLISLKTID